MDGSVYTLEELLDRSRATAAFKEAVRAVTAGGDSPLIPASVGSPPVKVQRTLMKVLEMYAEEPIEAVAIEARSGCSDYVGRLVIRPSGTTVRFDWNCAWRAREAGLVGFFKLPDQLRGVQEFGYQCFREFREVVADSAEG